MLLAMKGATILLPQFWAIARSYSSPTRVILLTISLGLLTLWEFYGAYRITLSSVAENGVFHDTSYVVSGFHYIFSLTLALLALSLLMLAAQRWSGPMPRISAPLASLLTFGFCGLAIQPEVTAILLDPPKRYADFPAYAARITFAHQATSIIAAIGFCPLVAISFWLLLRRLNQWSKLR